MKFDFVSYLRELDPAASYAIEKLGGGLVNETVRATKLFGVSEGRFVGHPSLILKHAPPYVAARGEGVSPFSPARQVGLTREE